MQLGIIGAGNMASAIIGGIVKKGIIEANGEERPEHIDSDLATIDNTCLGFVELDTSEAKIYKSNIEANQFYEI